MTHLVPGRAVVDEAGELVVLKPLLNLALPLPQEAGRAHDERGLAAHEAAAVLAQPLGLGALLVVVRVLAGGPGERDAVQCRLGAKQQWR